MRTSFACPLIIIASLGLVAGALVLSRSEAPTSEAWVVSDGASLAGELEVSRFVVPTGVRAFVEDDLTLVADTVEVNGELLVCGRDVDSGRVDAPDVLVYAAESIRVDGRIEGAAGRSRRSLLDARGGDGSTIELVAPVVWIDGVVRSGNGGDAGPRGRAGQAGDVTVRGRSLTTVKDPESELIAGNGGRGGDGFYPGEPGRPGGRGGDAVVYDPEPASGGRRAFPRGLALLQVVGGGGVPGTGGMDDTGENGEAGENGEGFKFPHNNRMCADGLNGTHGTDAAAGDGGDGGEGANGCAEAEPGGDGGKGGKGGKATGGQGGKGGDAASEPEGLWGGRGGGGGDSGDAWGGDGGNGGVGGMGIPPGEGGGGGGLGTASTFQGGFSGQSSTGTNGYTPAPHPQGWLGIPHAGVKGEPGGDGLFCPP